MDQDSKVSSGEKQRSKTMRRKPLTKEEKTIMWNVYQSLRKTYPVTDAMERCAFMTGVSINSITRIVREMKRTGSFQGPHTQSRGRKPFQLEDKHKQDIRHVVHSFYFERTIPTVVSVLNRLQEEDKDFPKIGREKMRKVLRSLDFSFSKWYRKSPLTEKPEIVSCRRKYLRSIRRFRAEQRKIYYLGETWVNICHTTSKKLAKKERSFLEGLSKSPAGKEERLIVAHIGSDGGFLTDGAVMFVSKIKESDREFMDTESFERWFENILQLIEANSVIVMEDVPWHNRQLEVIPTITSKKEDMKRWLQKHEIDFCDDMVKMELMGLIRQHDSTCKQYAIDSMCSACGIEVLRLPPYHSKLNPIELIWSQMKERVAKENQTCAMEDVRLLVHNALEEVQPLNWQNAISQIVIEENRMWLLDELMDSVLEPTSCDHYKGKSDSDSCVESMNI